MGEDQTSSLELGAQAIRAYVKTLPDAPGVYRMIGEGGAVLYVGKALSLKKRVGSYVQVHRLPVRLQRMVALTRSMEFVETHTEAEALLLESNLIKKLGPRFNILLRDDKSFPYILITGDHDFPLVTKHRGAKKRKGEYFGPFAGAGDVNRTLEILQRAFMLRTCPDTVFANRARPCLQYHIKRCTAPCVGRVDANEYGAQVEQARAFLEGRSGEVLAQMQAQMEEASAAQDYERAAAFRDRIKALAAVRAHQDINIDGIGDADIVALAQHEGKSCVQVFFFRAGRNYGNRSYFPRHDESRAPEEILGAFLAQFYENKPVPRRVIVSHAVEDSALIEEALSARMGKRVQIVRPSRGALKRGVDFAQANALGALKRKLTEKAHEADLLAKVAEAFGLDDAPERIEVYDNSHIAGTNMVGAMIVAGPEGFVKNAYRKFNIKTAGAGDDYAMMREVLERRFRKARGDEGARSGEDWPDIVMIDGGQGQYNAAKAVLEECGIFDAVFLVAIAKGEDRNAGRETFFIEGRAPFTLPVNDAALHYLQRLRDEAHRFAVGAHRTRRTMQLTDSPLDSIPGIGSSRKKALLNHFGSAKAVAQAGLKDLETVRGVSKSMAQKIYDHFH